LTGIREFVLILILFALAWFLRRSRVMYPLILVTTLLHECGHALAAILTGGKVKQIKVSRTGGGIATTQGGNRFIIYNTGYLGSIILGFLIFWLTYTRFGEYTLTILGTLLLFIILFWVRDIFTFFFSASIAIVLMVGGAIAQGGIEKFITRFLGVCCVLYSFLDMSYYIKNIKQVDFLIQGDDARALSQVTHIPAFVWRAVWWVISLGVLLLLFKVALKREIF